MSVSTNVNVDYDYDEVINFCKNEAQIDVSNLATHLNELCKEMVNCEDAFHSRNPNSIISNIYNGFKLIIGSTNEDSGVAGLIKEIANIINVCYSEAMNDRQILESMSPEANRSDNVQQTAEANVTNADNAQQNVESTRSNINFGDSSINMNKYSGSLHGRGNTSESAQATLGVVTTNNPKYQVVPDGEYTGGAGQISQSDYNLLIAQVAGEAGNSPDDMLGVTSTVLNRLESGSGFGDSVSQVFEQGYFPWGRSYLDYVEGGQYYSTDWGQQKLSMVTQVVNDALNGARNVGSNVYYYSGNGEYNKFSDNV